MTSNQIRHHHKIPLYHHKGNTIRRNHRPTRPSGRPGRGNQTNSRHRTSVPISPLSVWMPEVQYLEIVRRGGGGTYESRHDAGAGAWQTFPAAVVFASALGSVGPGLGLAIARCWGCWLVGSVRSRPTRPKRGANRGQAASAWAPARSHRNRRRTVDLPAALARMYAPSLAGPSLPWR